MRKGIYSGVIDFILDYCILIGIVYLIFKKKVEMKKNESINRKYIQKNKANEIK